MIGERKQLSRDEAMQIYLRRHQCLDMNDILDAMVYFTSIGDTNKAENLEFRLDRMRDMIDEIPEQGDE